MSQYTILTVNSVLYFLNFFLLTLVKRTGVSCEHIAINSCPDLINRRQTGFVLRI